MYRIRAIIDRCFDKHVLLVVYRAHQCIDAFLSVMINLTFHFHFCIHRIDPIIVSFDVSRCPLPRPGDLIRLEYTSS